MTTVRIPISGSPTNRSGDLNVDQRFVNCFPEIIQNPTTNDRKIYLTKRDGVQYVAQPSGTTGVARGLYSWNSKVYAIIGTGVYSGAFLTGTWAAVGTTTITITITSHGYSNGNSVNLMFGNSLLTDGIYTVAGVTTHTFTITHATSVATSSGSALSSKWTSIKTLSTSTGAVGFTEFSAANDYLVLLDGSKGYYISTTDTVTEITDAQFPTPHLPFPVFMDEFLFVQKTTGEIYNCDSGDIVNWQASSYLSPESFPDGAVAICRQNNMLVSLGVDSIEFFFDAANPTPGSPLGPNTGILLQYGCASGQTIAQEEGLVIFVARSQLGEPFVVALDGAKDNNISTEAINRILVAEGDNIVDSWGFLTRMKGHMMYVLNLPSQSRTLVFDVQTQMWNEWEWYSGSTDGRFPFINATEFNNTVICLHESNGKLYRFSPTIYQDEGRSLKVLIQTSRFDADTVKLKFLDRMEIINDWQTSASSMSIYWSDDDYKTWSSARTTDLSSRAYIYRCGSFRRRAFRLYSEANTPLRLTGMEFEIRLGTH